MKEITPELKKKLLHSQRTELTEARVYQNMAKLIKDKHNREVIEKIAKKELSHAAIWGNYTQVQTRPYPYKVWLYTLITYLFGLTFGLKFMEKGEEDAIFNYKGLSEQIPQAKEIQKDEEDHEQQLLSLIDDKSLNYLGSVVLGLNDALVELIGILAGLTIGLQNSKMIAFVGIITGISAALSMAGSEYLSTKTEGDSKISPITASIYTGIAYILTVIFLILPFLLLTNVFIALGISIFISIIIILIFNYYASVSKGYAFKKRFLEMICISLGVAFISFIIGVIVKQFFNLDM